MCSTWDGEKVARSRHSKITNSWWKVESSNNFFLSYAEIPANMSDVKTLVRIVITLICLHGIIVSGQTLTRRQLRLQQRQQTQVDQQQELLEKQLLSQVGWLWKVLRRLFFSLPASDFNLANSFT